MRDESRDLLLDSEDVGGVVLGYGRLVYVRTVDEGWNLTHSTGMRYVPFQQYQKIVDLVSALKEAMSDMSGDLGADEQSAYNELSELLK